MSGALDHSPADIVATLLIALGLGQSPTENTPTWPIFVSREPDTPDSVITVYDTSGRLQGRFQTSGEVQEAFGIQVRVRDASHQDGYAKARAIAVALDESISQESVTVDAATYTVVDVARTSGVFTLGTESPESKRNIFTINAVASLLQTS